MKQPDILKKAREKARSMPPKKKLAGNQEKCSLKPWEVFEIWLDFETTD